MKGLFLIDHVNVAEEIPSLSLILQSWVSGIESKRGTLGGPEIHLRSYGGWWRAAELSLERSAAAAFYQDNSPSLISVAGTPVRVSFEFADYLLADSYRLTRIDHTVAIRTRPDRLRAKIGSQMCSEPSCGSDAIIKWSRSKSACLLDACPRKFEMQFERLEQKQVDVHLGADLLLAAAGEQYDELAVLTSDLDLVPALIAAALVRGSRGSRNSISLARTAKCNRAMDPQLALAGVQLIPWEEQ